MAYLCLGIGPTKKQQALLKYIDEYVTANNVSPSYRDIQQALKVLAAYTTGRWDGDLLELLAPCHAGLEGMPPIRDDALPDDWFEKTSTCGHACTDCNYCENVFQRMVALATAKGGE